LQLEKLVSVACIERQLANRGPVHHRAELRGGCVHNGRDSGHFHGFRCAAKLQSDVYAKYLVEIQCDSLAYMFLEARRGEIYLVVANRHFQKEVFSVSAGFRLARCIRRFVGQRNLRSGDRAAARIRHRAANAPAGALRAGRNHSWKRGDCEQAKQHRAQTTKSRMPNGDI